MKGELTFLQLLEIRREREREEEEEEEEEEERDQLIDR